MSGLLCRRPSSALAEEEVEGVSRWQRGSSPSILSALTRPGEPHPTFLMRRTWFVREQIWD